MIERKTIFSPCRKYRYTLWREWDWSAQSHIVLRDLFTPKARVSYVQFIGLNPSTADEVQDDPTVRRCICFAKSWGFGSLCMTNAFAFRATDPKVMKAHEFDSLCHIVNVDWIVEIAKDASLVVAAWGKDGSHVGRDKVIVRAFERAGIALHCLGTNNDGTPKHPLYLSQTLKPIPFSCNS
jgi:hypothetical protein